MKIVKSILMPVAVVLIAALGVAHAKQGGQSGGSAKQYAPGQQKKSGAAAGGAKSAKQYAPGQKKKTAGSKGSAKQYAPGQQKKQNQGTQ